jgi:hypothetical protein
MRLLEGLWLVPLRAPLGGLGDDEDGELDGKFSGKVETRPDVLFGPPEAGPVGCCADILRRPRTSLLVPDSGCKFGKPGGDIG